MQYFGGKAKIAKDVANYLKSIKYHNQLYIEPFIGSANVFCLMRGRKVGYDIHRDLIMLLQEVRDGTFEYPKVVTEDDYKRLKYSDKTSALRAFVGFGCSFSGKWFGGYARNNRDENYIL